MYNQKPLLGTLPNYAHSLTPNIGAWIMNEGSGNKIYDIVGRNHGVFTNSPVWVTQGIDFTRASSQYIAFDVDPVPADKVTIVMSFKESASTGIDSHLGSYSSASGNSCHDYVRETHTRLYFDFGGEVDGTSRIIANYPAGWLGNNHFLAYRAEATKGMSIWADGKLLASHMGNTPTKGTENAFWIGGAFGAGSATYHDNSIYFVYLYNHVLTDSQLSQLYYDPYCWLAQPMGAELMYAAPPVGVISPYYYESLMAGAVI